MFTLNTTEQKPAVAPEGQKFRSQMGQILRHSTVFIIGAMFTPAMGYLFKVYLARVLGVPGPDSTRPPTASTPLGRLAKSTEVSESGGKSE